MGDQVGGATDPISALLPITARRNAAGHLVLGECDVVELAREYGTPLYIYDEKTLRQAARAYRTALERHYSSSSSVAYASKAYTGTALLHIWNEEGLELDVVGPGELEIALRAGFAPKRIHLHGNNKPPSLLARAVKAGVGRVVLDGWRDLDLIAEMSPPSPVRAWIRIAPGIDAHTHHHRKTGLSESKFGFSLPDEAAHAVRRALAHPNLELCGLHAHIGSQIFQVEPFIACAQTLIEFAATMREQLGWVPAELSPGGGWGVPYTPDQKAAPPEVLIAPLCRAVIEGCEEHSLPLPHLVVEPGRSLVARAGVALYTSGRVKETPGGRVYVALDGGLGDNPRPALYGARYTALCANRDDAPDQTVTLCGPFCESGDVLACDVPLPRLRPGDLVAVPVSGAYHLAMASSYNGFPRPAAIMVADGQARVVRRRETVEDLVSWDVP